MKSKTIEEIYQKKTQLEHILLRPDTYIGSVEHDTQQLWVFDQATQKFVYRSVKYVPGLYKIFGKLFQLVSKVCKLNSFYLYSDEILVNAADNF